MTPGCLLLALLSCAAAPAYAESPIVITGNIAITEEVYRAVIDLPDGAPANAAIAELVRTRAQNFLHRSGYELATVHAQLAGEQIVLSIDEGRVDKVLIFGQGAYNTLRAKIELSLPFNVYNRLLLVRELARLAVKYQLTEYRFELVQVEKEKHFGPQLDRFAKIKELELLDTLRLLPPERPYELHITLASREWQEGMSPDVSFNSLEGLGLGVRDRETDSFLEGDRLELRTRLGATFRDKIDQSRSRPVLARVFAESRWFTPPLIDGDFRTSLYLRADLLSSQRADLGVESYLYSRLEASVNAEYQFVPEWTATLGGGIEHRQVFNIEGPLVMDGLRAETPRAQARPFVLLETELVFNPDEIRRDRRHTLRLESRAFMKDGADRPHSLRVGYDYRAVVLFGWNELVIKSRGVSLHGDVLFADEQAIGSNNLRGPFPDLLYVHRLASAGVEMRVSLARDFFKVSVFHDLVFFGRFDRLKERTVRGSLANAFGAGAHVLILDAFQLDAYYGVGFTTGQRFDHGLVLSLQQAF